MLSMYKASQWKVSFALSHESSPRHRKEMQCTWQGQEPLTDQNTAALCSFYRRNKAQGIQTPSLVHCTATNALGSFSSTCPKWRCSLIVRWSCLCMYIFHISQILTECLLKEHIRTIKDNTFLGNQASQAAWWSAGCAWMLRGATTAGVQLGQEHISLPAHQLFWLWEHSVVGVMWSKTTVSSHWTPWAISHHSFPSLLNSPPSEEAELPGERGINVLQESRHFPALLCLAELRGQVGSPGLCRAVTPVLLGSWDTSSHGVFCTHPVNNKLSSLLCCILEHLISSYIKNKTMSSWQVILA